MTNSLVKIIIRKMITRGCRNYRVNFCCQVKVVRRNVRFVRFLGNIKMRFLIILFKKLWLF